MTVHTISYTNRGSVDRWNVDLGQYERYENASLIENRPFNAQDTVLVNLVSNAVLADSSNFLSRVGVALTANNAYAAKIQAGTATNADHIAHVQVMNRELQALIIFTVFDVDSD